MQMRAESGRNNQTNSSKTQRHGKHSASVKPERDAVLTVCLLRINHQAKLKNRNIILPFHELFHTTKALPVLRYPFFPDILYDEYVTFDKAMDRIK